MPAKSGVNDARLGQCSVVVATAGDIAEGEAIIVKVKRQYELKPV